MDDRWETEVIEYGAINITGFRIVDASRRMVREFMEGWRKVESGIQTAHGTISRDTISVCNLSKNCNSVYKF
jgi:hypothetical protein